MRRRAQLSKAPSVQSVLRSLEQSYECPIKSVRLYNEPDSPAMPVLAMNAPTLDKAHWAARIAQGKDTLYKHAIEGFHGPDGGVMPPKGGNPALTDAQVEATVDWMLGQLK